MSDELRIPCDADSFDHLLVREGSYWVDDEQRAAALEIDACSVHLSPAKARQVYDFIGRWLRAHEVQHTSNDLTDGDGAESIAAAVAHHMSPSGRVHPYVTGEDIHAPLDEERR